MIDMEGIAFVTGFPDQTHSREWLFSSGFHKMIGPALTSLSVIGYVRNFSKSDLLD